MVSKGFLNIFGKTDDILYQIYHELTVGGAKPQFGIIHDASLGGMDRFAIDIEIRPLQRANTGHTHRHRLLDKHTFVLRVNVPQSLKIHGGQLIQHVLELSLVQG